MKKKNIMLFLKKAFHKMKPQKYIKKGVTINGYTLGYSNINLNE